MKRIADLFCGAGGTSTGILAACRDLSARADLLAVNHWTTAINTHSLNHPGVRHLCESLDNIAPQRAVAAGHLHLLAASPECTHHSLAAGGRPKNDQSRATAWHVCRWAADLRVDNILIENVREFQNWGPLFTTHNHGCKGIGKCRKRCHHGKPIPERKGETFRAFVAALRSMSYNVDWRIVNAAEFGDPTSRQRLILMACRDRAVVWPTPTHGDGLKPFRSAREIIDWSNKGKSIFGRSRPLSERTLGRIADGLNQHGGKPFVIHVTHHGKRRTHSADLPLPTITTAKRGELMLIEPFIVKYYGSGKSVDRIDAPLATVTTKDRFMLVTPVMNKLGVKDVLARMFEPHELAAAMSFPKSYQFTGTRGDQVKQIGNAVPVQLARAHARALLS